VAAGIVKQSAGDLAASVAALRQMEPADESAVVEAAVVQSVAAQVAGLLRPGTSGDFAETMRSHLGTAGPAGRRGIEQYLAAWAESLAARTSRGDNGGSATWPVPQP